MVTSLVVEQIMSPVSELEFATKCLIVDENEHGCVTTPISLSTTFKQTSPGNPVSHYDYSRSGNPTRSALDNALARLENAEYGFTTSSGSAALMLVMHLINPGDHVIVGEDCYGGTYRYLTNISTKKHNIEVSFVDTTDQQIVKSAIKDNTKLIWIETPSNPNLLITDIKALSQIVSESNLGISNDNNNNARQEDEKKNGDEFPILLVVDNTFLSSYFQKPLDLGADVVVHSLTKYMNGHSDVVMGSVCTNNKPIADRLQFLLNSMGVVPAPFDCYMALRGIKTLPLRMRTHEENAIKVASFLESHPRVTKVSYPGLLSHPQHALATTQMSGFGGMIAFYIDGSDEDCITFITHLKHITLAESLGAVESIIEIPGIMTHASMAPALRDKLGITNTLVRLSVGVEHINDLINDLTAALNITFPTTL